MKTWEEFSLEEPELAALGKNMLVQDRACVGLAFLATIRKDGAPRLHPVSLVFSRARLYVFIPPRSPKCLDLKRDGRYALQAFPPVNNNEGKEFYLSGAAQCVSEPSTRQNVVEETGIHVEQYELMFELLVERAMYTYLVSRGTPDEHPYHRIWPASTVEPPVDKT